MLKDKRFWILALIALLVVTGSGAYLANHYGASTTDTIETEGDSTWDRPITLEQFSACQEDCGSNAACAGYGSCPIPDWPRPITLEQFNACQENCSLNGACAGYGACPYPAEAAAK